MRSAHHGPRRIGRWTTAAILTLSCAAVALVVSAQSAPLALVSTAWPPFTDRLGQPRFALDLVEAALGRIGVRSTTAIVSAAEFTPSLVSGKVDGSAAAWKDAERDGALLFSQPYLENRLVLIGRPGSDVSAKALADLKSKRIAIVEGYSYGDEIQKPGGPAFVLLSSEEDSLASLLKGTVDYTLMDDLVVQYIVNNYPKEAGAKLQIGTTPLVTRALYLAVRRSRPDAQAIINGFNDQLRGMIADRTYHRLLHLDWIRADINADGLPEYVPVSDQAGPTEPQRVYTLFTGPETAPRTPEKPGFYLGGTIYTDWASVPDSYKTIDTQRPDPKRSTASLFRFSW